MGVSDFFREKKTKLVYVCACMKGGRQRIETSAFMHYPIQSNLAGQNAGRECDRYSSSPDKGLFCDGPCMTEMLLAIANAYSTVMIHQELSAVIGLLDCLVMEIYQGGCFFCVELRSLDNRRESVFLEM